MQAETREKQPVKPIGKGSRETSMEATKGALQGEVIFFSAAKGFGFLSREDGENDLFCHFSAIDMEGYKTLKQGQRVVFETEQGKNGLQACNVKVVEDAKA
jgi:cold shock protein